MNHSIAVLISLTIWFLSITSPVAAQPVDPATQSPHFSLLAQKAEKQGTVRVIVQMAVPEINTLEAASVRFKAGRLEGSALAQAKAADKALAARITATADNVVKRIKSKGAKVRRRYKALPLIALEVSADALGALGRDPQVLQITEDRLRRPMLDDTVEIIGAADSFVSGYTGAGWYVAILDTGIHSSHEFFDGKSIVEACYSAEGHCPNDETSMTGTGAAAHHPNSYVGYDHGTHVAGIAAGDNGTFSGVAKDADIIAIQVFSRFETTDDCGLADSTPCVLSWDSDILAGLVYIYSLRATYNIAAVNLSLGGGNFSANCDITYQTYKETIDELNTAGIATVVASGNEDYCDGVSAPACISTTVSVGATTDSDVMADFSNYRANLVDLFAPGSEINSSIPSDTNDSYASWGGTSMATPHVAGAFALLRQADSGASVAELLSALQSSGALAFGSSNCETSGETLPVPRIQVDDAISVTINPATAPIAPDNLTASTSASGPIDLSWRDNDINEQGFIIERRACTGGTYAQIATTGAGVPSYSDADDTRLELTSYCYQIKAYNGAGESAYSNEANATTLLAAPTNLSARAVSSTQINLTWTDNSTAELGYRIERRRNGSGYTQIAELDANTASYSDTNLGPFTPYFYRVRCFNGSDVSPVDTAVATTLNTGTSTTGGSSGGGCFISTLVP